MRSLVPVVVVGVACAATALLVQPRPRSSDLDTAIWPEAVVRVAALGRTYAAADVAWLKTVQIIGSDRLARQLWPNLERWVDLTTSLDARFDLPYFFGATLLVTDVKRAPEVDRLLARGERANPEEFMLPMLRGFLARFGLLDAGAAAAHFRRAASYPKAPAFIGAFADKLEREQQDCGGVLDDLRQMASVSSKEQSQALFQERGRILTHCFATTIGAAAVGYRLDHGTTATVEALVQEGRLPARPWAPDGQCWTIAPDDKALLGPCPGR